MMDDLKITITEDFFNAIELYEAPARIEGDVLYPRGRVIERRRDGTVVRDETYDIGTRITGWEDCAYLFGVATPRRSWWDRFIRRLI